MQKPENFQYSTRSLAQSRVQGFPLKNFKKKTYGHIFTSSSLDVAKPKSLLSVTTFKGSVHLDIADGAQSICAEIDVHNHELLIPEIYKKK